MFPGWHNFSSGSLSYPKVLVWKSVTVIGSYKKNNSITYCVIYSLKFNYVCHTYILHYQFHNTGLEKLCYLQMFPYNYEQSHP